MATSHGTSRPSGVYDTADFTSSTDVRDVSEILDAMYLKDTPFVNRIKWGAGSKNTKHEWVTDTIGHGYVVLSNGGNVASDASDFIIGTSGVGSIAEALKQLVTDTVLKYNGDSDKSNGYLMVADPAAGAGAGSCEVDFLSGTSCLITDAATLWVLATVANEGSVPRGDTSRARALPYNYMQIFRKDVRVTGTMAAMQMHAVPDEVKYQIMSRSYEYWRELEKSAIMGKRQVGSATETSLFGGVLDFLIGESGSHIDTTSTALDETKMNDVIQGIFDRGGNPDLILCGAKQSRKFAGFDRNRVRVGQDIRKAGWAVTKYLSDMNIELDILVSRWVPANFLFVLSSEELALVPMNGRKYNLTKLAVVGDYEEWQLISEVTFEPRGYSLGKHGMFTALT